MNRISLGVQSLDPVVLGGLGRQHDPEAVAVAVAGPDLFVANADVSREGSGDAYEGSSVTEFNTSTGALVSVLSSPQYMFEEPDALAVAGPDLFVANLSDGSVTDLTP